MSSITLYEVGGCVRDEQLGLVSKDIDYAVEAASYEVMRNALDAEGFKIFLENPEFVTLRAQFPPHRQRGTLTADFVLCRKDGQYTDGRRPDAVLAGTLYDDLARRDFTVNAMAKSEDGTLIDPFGGRADLAAGVLRAVGNAEDRLREDALRALRAVRFSITKGFVFDSELLAALNSTWLPPLLSSVSAERRREEMLKAFKADTVATLTLLQTLPRELTEAVFADGLWLKPTLEK